MDIITFKSSGPSGDLLATLAGIKQICHDRVAKADIYMWMDHQGFYYPGAEHPYGTSMFNQYAFDNMKPLIEAQTYVNSFKPWSGEQIMCDLDKHRERMVGMPYGSIHRWITYVYPDLQGDLTQPWLDVSQFTNDMASFLGGSGIEPGQTILINRTKRYNNSWIFYHFLNKYKDRLLFTGLPDEHEKFQEDWKFELPLLKVKDFYELAVALKACKFFIGNQSMCYGLAEALKVPRILEVCDFAPNVIPQGEHAHDFRFQEALEYFVSKLDKEL